MSQLSDYVMTYAERGACTCGKCCDAPEKPEDHQPEGHTVDLFFFKVSAKKGADADTFKALLLAHAGVFCEVDLFDGKEHGYMELGGWIGDQGLAMMMMGLGAALGLWKVMTPNSFGDLLPDDMKQMMAGQGMVTIIARRPPKGADDE